MAIRNRVLHARNDDNDVVLLNKLIKAQKKDQSNKVMLVSYSALGKVL